MEQLDFASPSQRRRKDFLRQRTPFYNKTCKQVGQLTYGVHIDADDVISVISFFDKKSGRPISGSSDQSSQLSHLATFEDSTEGGTGATITHSAVALERLLAATRETTVRDARCICNCIESTTGCDCTLSPANTATYAPTTGECPSSPVAVDDVCAGRSERAEGTAANPRRGTPWRQG
ncbi:Protein of unknown function [Gryllus bimaculatus]|nr:Protein of unknown function [Gryllus bimaculatus]